MPRAIHGGGEQGGERDSGLKVAVRLASTRWGSDEPTGAITTSTTDARRAHQGLTAWPPAWCLAVAFAYGLAQLLLLDSGRFLSWDEAVYVSEVSPFAEAVGMGAHRARGITFLVAPITVLTDSMVLLRACLAMVSSVALFGAFVVWCRTIRWAAPISMGLFASCWIVLFYGSAVYPNIHTALLAVAAIGVAIGTTDESGPQRRTVLVALVAAAALMRPLDGLTITVAVTLVGLLWGRRRLAGLAVSGLVGLGLGSLPWVVEAWIRFDGPIRRLEESGEIVGGGLVNNIGEYLRSLDGTGSVNPWALLWLGTLLLLGLVPLVSSRPIDRRVGAIALMSAFLFVAPYLFATDPVLQRFMLPGLAMVSIASGIGVTTSWSLLPARAMAAAGIAGILVVVAAWNLPTLREWDNRQAGNGETALRLGRAIRDETGDRSCFLLSPAHHPAVSFAAGCEDSWSLTESVDANLRRLDGARERGLEVFVVTVQEDPGTLIGVGWRCRPVQGLAHRGWQLCQSSDR